MKQHNFGHVEKKRTKEKFLYYNRIACVCWKPQVCLHIIFQKPLHRRKLAPRKMMYKNKNFWPVYATSERNILWYHQFNYIKMTFLLTNVLQACKDKIFWVNGTNSCNAWTASNLYSMKLHCCNRCDYLNWKISVADIFLYPHNWSIVLKCHIKYVLPKMLIEI